MVLRLIDYKASYLPFFCEKRVEPAGMAGRFLLDRFCAKVFILTVSGIYFLKPFP